MKNILAITLLAASLSAAHAQAPAIDPLKALEGIGKQHEKLYRSKAGNVVGQLDAIAATPYPPATAAAMAQVFGDPQALHLRRLPDEAGKRHYAIGFPAHAYQPGQVPGGAWSELDVRYLVDPSGRQMRTTGTLAQLRFDTREVGIQVEGMRLDSDNLRAPSGVWTGSAEVKTARLAFFASGQEVATLKELTGLVGLAANGKKSNITYEVGARELLVAGQVIDKLRMAFRMTNVDLDAMAKFEETIAKADKLADPRKKVDAMSKPLLSMLQQLGGNGTAFEIDEVSAMYKGHKASIQGRIALQGKDKAAFKTLDAALRKLTVELELRVPVALIGEVTLGIARAQVPKTSDGQPNEQAIAQAAQAMTDGVMGRLLGQGLARIDDGVIVSRIVYRNGKLTANGKPVPLPGPAPAGKRPLPASMPAREVSGSCERAPLPPEALRLQKPAAVTLGVEVGAKGEAGKITVLATSGWPEYDAAAVAAARNCKWIPAIVNGVEAASTVTVRHEAKPAGDAPR